MVTNPLWAHAVPDISHHMGSEAQKALADMIGQLRAKQHRNQIRAEYYDMHNRLRDLGIAIPPGLRDLDSVVGWAAKAVDMLARRVRMTGLAMPGDGIGQFGIDQIIAENDLPTLASMATVSTLIHATSFIVTEVTDDTDRAVQLSVLDATQATGRWGRNGLDLALVQGGVDDRGRVNRWVLLDRYQALQVWREPEELEWRASITEHGLGRVPVEPLVYRRRVGRRFGSSRITRSMMALINAAMRTLARSEVGAEFFAAPQRYMLGAEESMFVDESTGERKTLWDLVMGRMLAFPDATDQQGEPIKIGQFPQISMQPHVDQLRTIASLFAAEALLPVSALGISHDNPTSAEAQWAAKEDLIIEAEQACADFSGPWTRAVATGVQWRDNLNQPPTELAQLSVLWRDPATPSQAQATDAVIKQISAGILPADSPVALERLGYDAATITRIMEHRANAVPDGLSQLAAVLGQDS